MRNKYLREILTRLDRIECAVKDIHEHMNECNKFKVNSKENANEWMQEGIDNILGYQWPPKKGDGE